MTFHAVKRSMSISEGRKSWGAMFFLIRDCCLETEDLLLARETDVARESEIESFMLGFVWSKPLVYGCLLCVQLCERAEFGRIDSGRGVDEVKYVLPCQISRMQRSSAAVTSHTKKETHSRFMSRSNWHNHRIT